MQPPRTMSEIEVEEGRDDSDSGKAATAQGRDNIEWRGLLMTQPEAAVAKGVMME